MATNSMGDGQPVSGINVTPMVDIMLVLLVIFMVTSSAISASQSIAVDRPDAATGEPDEASTKTILITCDADGNYFEGAQALVGDSAVTGAVRSALASGGDLQAVLRCDRSASVDAMVHLLDLVRAAGVTRYAIQTDPVAEPTR